MKKWLALLFCVLISGSLTMISGCAPKQQEGAGAPAVEEAVPGAEQAAPGAEQAAPGAEQAAPGAGETAPAEEGAETGE